MKIAHRILPAIVLALGASIGMAGVLDPNCTAEKAAKSAAAKSTVGVGGRCSPAEAAKDTAKDVAGIEDKGPVEKLTDKNDTPVEKATDAAKEVVKK